MSKIPLAEAERFARAIATAADRDLAWAVFSDWLADHGADPAPALAAWKTQHAGKGAAGKLSPGEYAVGIGWESCAASTTLQSLDRPCSNQRCIGRPVATHLTRKVNGGYEFRAYNSVEDAWADLVLACCKSAGIEFSE